LSTVSTALHLLLRADLAYIDAQNQPEVNVARDLSRKLIA